MWKLHLKLKHRISIINKSKMLETLNILDILNINIKLSYYGLIKKEKSRSWGAWNVNEVASNLKCHCFPIYIFKKLMAGSKVNNEHKSQTLVSKSLKPFSNASQDIQSPSVLLIFIPWVPAIRYTVNKREQNYILHKLSHLTLTPCELHTFKFQCLSSVKIYVRHLDQNHPLNREL